MKHLTIVLTLWLAAIGCAGEDVNQQWNEALTDASGENTEMRNDFATPTTAPARKAPTHADAAE